MPRHAASPPDTRYARSGSYSIAYQVVGGGPTDLVFIPGFVSNVELQWEHEAMASFFSRLASFTRLIVFDKRGTGLSDRVPVSETPALEERMDDVRAVMDAAGSERATLFGISEGGPLALLFAATYPDRLSATPDTAAHLITLADATDVRAILPTIGAPTLVVHRVSDGWFGFEHGEHLAATIPDATLVALDGAITSSTSTRNRCWQRSRRSSPA